MIKQGTILMCIRTRGSVMLTEGYLYVVQQSTTYGWVRIVNDRGLVRAYALSSFKTILKP